MNAFADSSYIDNQHTDLDMNSIGYAQDSKKSIFSSLDFNITSTSSDVDLLDEIKSSNEKKTTTTPQMKRRMDTSEKYKLLGEWVGIVEKVNDKYFVAKVRDSLNSFHSKELAEFENDDILTSELKYLEEGAIFYWTIGYKTINNTKYKVSNINFRKVLPISNALKEKAEEQSKNLISFFAQF
jgi:hypothetical protein